MIGDAGPNLVHEILRRELGLSNQALFKNESPPFLGEKDIVVDLTIQDGDRTYLVEVKNLATHESLAILSLIKTLASNSSENSECILAAKDIPPQILTLAQELGIKVIQLPYTIPLNSVKDDKGRITTENAWIVIDDLLETGWTSIRQVSKRTGISYAWAHRIVNRLIARCIATRHHDTVRISDTARLLNAVALERPMVARNLGVVTTNYTDSFGAAVGLTRALRKSDIVFSFTAHTAASLFVGYAISYGAVYLYLQDEGCLKALQESETKVLGNVRIHAYKPDRDVFKDSQDVQGVHVVSKAQALLDLAGFGRSARDLAVEMVKRYADISSSDG